MTSVKIGSKIRDIKPINMGQDYFPTIFVNVGISERGDITHELQKAKNAISAGADIVSELSLTDNIADAQKYFLDELSVPVASVAVYEAYLKAKKNDFKISDEEVVRIFENSAKRGIDVITLHATVNRNDLDVMSQSKRIIPTTSRGGAMMLKLMMANNYENPYVTYFDDILTIAAKYNVCLSLGPMYRAGAVTDCAIPNDLDYLELERMSQLVARAQEKGVGIVIEGIGHASLDKIKDFVPESIAKCNNAPYRVLTVATDIALGYDHISSSIAAANAVMYGASSITAVTRSEHIGHPSDSDVIEAVIAAKIAAHCGFSARNKDFSRDMEMSLMRKQHGCIGNPALSICPNAVNKDKGMSLYVGQYSCNMCGEYCPFELISQIKKGS